MNDDTSYTISLDTDSTSTSTITYTGTDHSETTIGGMTFTLPNDDVYSSGDLTFDTTYSGSFETHIDPVQVENMCQEYPALQKVWRNFKSVYDLTLQDYKGKQKAGDLDDEIPF